MHYGTLCSGIDGAAAAWKPLGWRHVFCAEVDPFCCALLKHHYPDVPNYGDITKIETTPAIDVLVAGTPCQSFSMAGNRKGLDDDRGQLALAMPRIASAARPRWIVWENVPGVLSSNGGKDFGTFLWSLAELGYGLAYRVLDAEYFGVPQSRRRVFVVGHQGEWQRAAAVLFDAESCEQDARSAGEIRRQLRDANGQAPETLVGWAGDGTPKQRVGAIPTMRASQGGEGTGFISEQEFRRLTLLEMERCQGFPDGYTRLEGAGDTQRRKALGNSFCVHVLRWIGERIEAVQRL